jgi:hypothetical protein
MGGSLPKAQFDVRLERGFQTIAGPGLQGLGEGGGQGAVDKHEGGVWVRLQITGVTAKPAGHRQELQVAWDSRRHEGLQDPEAPHDKRERHLLMFSERFYSHITANEGFRLFNLSYFSNEIHRINRAILRIPRTQFVASIHNRPHKLFFIHRNYCDLQERTRITAAWSMESRTS